MKILLAWALLLNLSMSSFGNDGVYLTKGGLIYPTQETKISLEKEILTFKVRDHIAYVSIQFEFNNPETIDRKLLVGFQAPTAEGDVPDSLSNTNQIKDFIIIQSGTILPYTLKSADCDTCELKDPTEIHFSQFNTGLFVFLFEITFKPGMNRLDHSYNFPASHNVAFDQFYKYILTTGSKWAGEKIKELTVNIDMGQNKYFYVNDIYGRSADWSVIGTGKLTDEKFDYVDADTCRMVRTLSGYLQIKVTDFQPIKNIEFGIVSDHSFAVWPVYYEKFRDGSIASIGDLSLNADHTLEELRLLRNTIYAQYGYDFKDAALKQYFSQFAWYMPDPNLKMGDIEMTEAEKEYVTKILMLEKER